jgi:hypothetical protein
MSVDPVNKPTSQENLQEIQAPSGRRYKGEYLGNQTSEIMRQQHLAELEKIRQQRLTEREKWIRKLLFVL